MGQEHRLVDVAGDGFDAVIRHGPILDRRLIARPLAASRRLLVASPAYLAAHGEPRSLSELEAHRAILYGNRDCDWRFTERGATRLMRPPNALRVNNCFVIRDAAVAGLGMALLPTFTAYAEIASGALQVLDVGADAEGAQIFVAYLAERPASAKLRALTDHIRKAFGAPPYWEATLAALLPQEVLKESA
jgi:DNA-binding transcriptional LysR family regulator